MRLSIIVLTKNSEKEIDRTLKSVLFADEIITIDDNSNDNTLEVAKKYNAKIFKRDLNGNFSAQRNFGLSKASGEWIFFVDSDEEVSKQLASEILSKITSGNNLDGYFVKRQDIMWGKVIKHGENGSNWILRLAKKDSGEWMGKVHETWKVKGEVGNLENTLFHYPHLTIAEFLKEINFYTTIRAQELFEKKVKVNWYDIILYPKAKFLQNYIFRKGFMDGTVGFVLAILMSMHSFLVRGKLWQLQKNK
ncbi:MAG TPA: glycosyltransferase family 2 protein [Patescibacteria group bacterium]